MHPLRSPLRAIFAAVLSLSLVGCDLPTFDIFPSPESASLPPAETAPPAPGAIPGSPLAGPTIVQRAETAAHKVVIKVKGKHGRTKKVVRMVPGPTPAAQPKVAAKLPAPESSIPYSCATVRFWSSIRTEAQLKAMAAAAGVTVTPSQEREARKCLSPKTAIPSPNVVVLRSIDHGAQPCIAAERHIAATMCTRTMAQIPSRLA